MNKNKVIFLTACLLTSSCGGDVKETLGLNRKGPDEYQVLSRPALTVPPEFSLRPPEKNESNSASNAPDKARSKVIGNEVFGKQQSRNINSTDAQFLNNAGASKVNRNIREKINEDMENGVVAKDNKYLLGVGGSSQDPIVDAKKEADRIKDNKEKSKPVNNGETPVVAPKSKGIIGDIF